MSSITIFVLGMVVMIAVLLVLIMRQVGFNYAAVKKYFEHSEGAGKTPLKSALGIIVVMLMLMAAVYAFGYGIKAAKAEEIKWFNTGSVFIGLDRVSNGSVFCQDTPQGVNKNINSNMGAKGEIASFGPHIFGWKLTHHSCAINPDKNGYDAPGIYWEYVVF